MAEQDTTPRQDIAEIVAITQTAFQAGTDGYRVREALIAVGVTETLADLVGHMTRQLRQADEAIDRAAVYLTRDLARAVDAVAAGNHYTSQIDPEKFNTAVVQRGAAIEALHAVINTVLGVTAAAIANGR